MENINRDERRKAILDKQRKDFESQKMDFNQTFGTPHGRRTLFRLMGMCGYQRPSVVADKEKGEIQINSTVYNEARRNLYLTVRQFLNPDILRDVEHRSDAQGPPDLFS